MLPLLLDGWLWLTAAAWGLAALVWLIGLRVVRRLPPARSGSAAGEPLPRVSVIVAARDEQDRIDTTVRRLLDQRGVGCEPIVVDDRSADGTAGRLAAIAAREPALRVIRIETLPAGWLGKCHALHAGAAAATGDWLLFTDADTWMERDLVARAVAAAVADGAAHLCVVPHQRIGSAWGRAANLAFALVLIGQAAGANRDRPGSFIGIGAFNLVRADAYRAIGGHGSLRMDVVDDLKLGLLLRRAGHRTRVWFSGPDMEVAWAATGGGILRALEKNSFAMFRYSLARAGAAFAASAGLWLTAVLGPLTARPGGYAAAAGFASLVVPAVVASRRAGWGILPALLTPLALVLMPLSVARSTWVALRRGGVTWRGTFYPLPELRRGVVK